MAPQPTVAAALSQALADHLRRENGDDRPNAAAEADFNAWIDKLVAVPPGAPADFTGMRALAFRACLCAIQVSPVFREARRRTGRKSDAQKRLLSSDFESPSRGEIEELVVLVDLALADCVDAARHAPSRLTCCALFVALQSLLILQRAEFEHAMPFAALINDVDRRVRREIERIGGGQRSPNEVDASRDDDHLHANLPQIISLAREALGAGKSTNRGAQSAFIRHVKNKYGLVGSPAALRNRMLRRGVPLTGGQD